MENNLIMIIGLLEFPANALNFSFLLFKGMKDISLNVKYQKIYNVL